MSRPLQGRRIVVTRAADQVDELMQQLTALGAEPIVIPLIQTVDPADGGTSLVEALAHLGPSDWLVVTSPNGARRVADWLRDLVEQGSDRPLVAAVGTATAAVLDDALRPHHVDLVPDRQSSDGLVQSFPSSVGAGRVLLTNAESAGADLVDGLRDKGWQVEQVAAYRTVARPPSAGELLRALAADAVLFASGSAVRAWSDAFGTATPPIVIAIGPATAAVAAEFALKVDAVATDHSLGGLVSCLLTQLGDSG